jgi:NAD(P)H-dependent FMN reductase
LDSFFSEFNRKPVGIIGVSSGAVGGARMVEQLRLVAIAFEMVPINAVVYFSNAKELFDEKGVFLKKETYAPRFKKFFDELVWYARALKATRGKK